MIRASLIACAGLLAAPAQAMDPQSIFGLTAMAQADMATVRAQVAAIYPQVELTLVKDASGLAADAADPAYLHINGHAFTRNNLGNDTQSGVLCTRLGPPSLARLDAAAPGALIEELPHFRFVEVPLAPGARAMMSCLFQHQTFDAAQPFARKDVLHAMQAYPGQTVERVLPTPDPTGQAHWFERQHDPKNAGATPSGGVVARLGFVQGSTGQDLSFVVQIYE